jgi:hypothetical protein
MIMTLQVTKNAGGFSWLAERLQTFSMKNLWHKEKLLAEIMF